MENENKPVKENTEKKNNRRGHHGHHNRSKGYFITPAGGDVPKASAEQPQKEKPKAEPKAAPAPVADGGNERKSGNSRNNRRRRRPHGSSNAQKPVEQVERAQQNAQPKKEKDNKKQSGKQQADHKAAPAENNRQKTGAGETSGRSHHGRHGRHHQPPSYKELTLKETLDEPMLPIAEEEPEEETVDIASISPDVLETPRSMPVVDETVPRIEVVGIRFKASGKIYYFDPAGKPYTRGSYAIVETARGLEYGEIALANTMVKETDVVPPLRPIVREATKNDQLRHEENKKKEADALKLCAQKIAEHKLDMKLIDAQYTFDNSKLLFYFTSAGRVDFRELVKDLASVFRTRIELRQIGIRDEAKMMGGLGLCGRPLCCSVFLSDFCQVSIKMAKEQNFSLNSSKISGMCGRLMCCLRFEYETYEYEIKRTPPVDSVVETPDGTGVVIENSPLVGTVKVRLSVTPEVAPKVYRREDVTVLQKKQSNPNNGNNNKSNNNNNKK